MQHTLVEFPYNAQKEVNPEPLGAIYTRPEAEGETATAESHCKASDDRAGRARVTRTMARGKKSGLLPHA